MIDSGEMVAWCIAAAMLRSNRTSAIAAIAALQYAYAVTYTPDEIFYQTAAAVELGIILSMYLLPASNFTIRIMGISGLSVVCHALAYFALIPVLVYDSAIEALLAIQLITMLLPDELNTRRIADIISRALVRPNRGIGYHCNTKEMP